MNVLLSYFSTNQKNNNFIVPKREFVILPSVAWVGVNLRVQHLEFITVSALHSLYENILTGHLLHRFTLQDENIIPSGDQTWTHRSLLAPEQMKNKPKMEEFERPLKKLSRFYQ